jgi:alkylation response protein AidB-like acyl-CoA dehydrogenase
LAAFSGDPSTIEEHEQETNMSTEPKTTPRGGSFLIETPEPEDIFTPEDFDEEAEILAKTTRDFVANEVEPVMDQLEAKEEGLMVKILKKAGEIGLLAVDIPEAFGGLEAPKSHSMLLVENLARGGGFPVTHGAHAGIGTLPIVYFGTNEQKQKWLPGLATGEIIGSYALTEQSSGSDALAAKATAKLDGDEWVLNGEKQFITNAGFADLCIVFAKVDGEEFTAFIVPMDTPGVSAGPEEHKMGIRGSSTTSVIMQDARIPKDYLLGEIGKGHVIAFNILNVGRFKLGAGAVGGAKECINESIKYGRDRTQFGQPLTSFPLIQGKLADMAALAYAGESATYRTSGLLDGAIAAIDPSVADHDRAVIDAIEEHSIECSIIKVLGSEVLDFAVDECVQIFGGYGYVEDYPAERYFRDARINRIYEGTNEINRMVITGTLLKRAMKGELPLLAAAKQVQDALMAIPDFGNGGEKPDFADAMDLLDRSKKAILLVSGVAALKYGPKIQKEQEVLAWLATMAIETYAFESAVLRARKMSAAGKEIPMVRDLVDILAVRQSALMLQIGTEALSHTSEGDDLRMQLAGLKRFAKLAEPIDGAMARRRVAEMLVDNGGYKLPA